MTKAKKILVFEDDPNIVALVEHHLTKVGYDVVANSGFGTTEAVEETVFQESPDVILCDILMEPDGFEILKTIKNHSQLRLIPFIFVTVMETLPEQVKAYWGGADNYITKPIRKDELVAKVNSVLKRQENVEAAIYLDPLTQIHNRRFFQKELKRQIKLHRRHGDKFILALLDLDHFKSINDTYGHTCGDHSLIAFTKYVRSQIRSTDIFARWGGEEFLLLMERSQTEGAVHTLKKILDNTKSQLVITCDEQTVRLSFSAGVAEYPTHGKTADELVGAADQAVYRAKELGRGRVEAFYS